MTGIFALLSEHQWQLINKFSGLYVLDGADGSLSSEDDRKISKEYLENLASSENIVDKRLVEMFEKRYSKFM